METCPFSGLPCFQDKTHRICEIEKNKCVSETHLCDKCGLKYVAAIFQPKVTTSISVKSEDITQEIPIFVVDPIQMKSQIVITSVSDLVKLFEGKGIPLPEQETKNPCPQCEMTIDNWNREGKFGCQFCYIHFYEEFLALAGPFQEGQDYHSGKRPKRWIESLPKAEKLKVLRLKMARAIEMENFEEADSLKNLINDVCSSPQ